MGLDPAEASQLFSLIDRDGSGSIDLAEFTQLMRSVPLQQPLGKTLVGATVGMMRSLVTLDASLAGKLRGEQPAKAATSSSSCGGGLALTRTLTRTNPNPNPNPNPNRPQPEPQPQPQPQP